MFCSTQLQYITQEKEKYSWNPAKPTYDHKAMTCTSYSSTSHLVKQYMEPLTIIWKAVINNRKLKSFEQFMQISYFSGIDLKKPSHKN